MRRSQNSTLTCEIRLSKAQNSCFCKSRFCASGKQAHEVGAQVFVQYFDFALIFQFQSDNSIIIIIIIVHWIYIALSQGPASSRAHNSKNTRKKITQKKFKTSTQVKNKQIKNQSLTDKNMQDTNIWSALGNNKVYMRDKAQFKVNKTHTSLFYCQLSSCWGLLTKHFYCQWFYQTYPLVLSSLCRNFCNLVIPFVHNFCSLLMATQMVTPLQSNSLRNLIGMSFLYLTLMVTSSPDPNL